jgi:hypothetical protein
MGGGYRTPPIAQSITSAAHDDDRRLELRLNGRSSLPRRVSIAIKLPVAL